MIKNRNIPIQILRVCACLMVFLVHFGQVVDFTGTIRSFTDFGRMGVYLFFLISGFLAGSTFFDKPVWNIKQYYCKRMISILPLYYLVIAFYFITETLLNFFVPIIPPDELGLGWVRYIFCLTGFLDSEASFWSNLGGTWTIPIFLFFYIIAPFTLRNVNSVRSSVFLWCIVHLVTLVLNRVYTCSIFSNLHFLFWGVVLYACVHKQCQRAAAVLFSCLAICMIILNRTLYAYVAIFSSIFLVAVSIEYIALPDWLSKVINALDKYSYTMYLIHCAYFRSFIS